MRRIKNPKPNEYVLISRYPFIRKYPYTPWALGWFTRKGDRGGKTTYYIKEEHGNESTYPKYFYCFRLTIDEGRNWMYLYYNDKKDD